MKKYLTIVLSLMVLSFGNIVLADDNDNGQDDPIYTADNCLDGQDMSAVDVDITNCPVIAGFPEDAPMKGVEGEEPEMVSLGAWELGMTSTGDAYKYGSLNDADQDQRHLKYYDEELTADVDAMNISCWAKGYFRLRKILQDPPAEYITLRNAGFQTRFFQFQTDLRNGDTGYKQISSFRDHLVKWVTLIERDENGRFVCTQPNYDKFRDYAKSELERRGL